MDREEPYEVLVECYTNGTANNVPASGSSTSGYQAEVASTNQQQALPSLSLSGWVSNISRSLTLLRLFATDLAYFVFCFFVCMYVYLRAFRQ